MIKDLKVGDKIRHLDDKCAGVACPIEMFDGRLIDCEKCYFGDEIAFEIDKIFEVSEILDESDFNIVIDIGDVRYRINENNPYWEKVEEEKEMEITFRNFIDYCKENDLNYCGKGVYCVGIPCSTCFQYHKSDIIISDLDDLDESDADELNEMMGEEKYKNTYHKFGDNYPTWEELLEWTSSKSGKIELDNEEIVEQSSKNREFELVDIKTWEEKVENGIVLSHDSNKDYKDMKGKLPLQLVHPIAIETLAKCSQYGINKYGIENKESYMNGEVGTYIGAMLRHLSAYQKGEIVDPESHMLHLEHMFMNAYIILRLIDRDKSKEDK